MTHLSLSSDIADEALAKAGEEPFSDEDDGDDKYAHEHKPLPAELAAVVGGATFEACEASCRAGLTLDRSSQPLRELLQKLRDSGFSTDVASDVAMADTAAADVLKAEGNTKFAAKQFKAAITSYTSGLAQDPTNHVLYERTLIACHFCVFVRAPYAPAGELSLCDLTLPFLLLLFSDTLIAQRVLRKLRSMSAHSQMLSIACGLHPNSVGGTFSFPSVFLLLPPLILVSCAVLWSLCCPYTLGT